MRQLFLAAVLCWAPAVAHADAFGIKPGQPIAELNIVSENMAPYLFDIEPPEFNRNFSHYQVIASQNLGVCMVRGTSTELQVETMISLKADLVAALTKLYGEPTIDGDRVRFPKVSAPLTEVVLRADGQTLQLSYSFRNSTDCMADATELDTTGL